ncbi:hypothetical protein [Paractinoplanes hotanensis]|uniref:Uncharacterized protein n=1 Tax=Paractinoplanes hotanensis TaxID=2906497 RepID=A0ABT0Y511_9ACTN|nr:hypothetical protein [Actinoplanes hotanensis]MCM4081102.1 hypothetical protein [Actinoplanes hotanensis]
MNAGVCLTAAGAVFAVIRTGPDRLVAVAEILAPGGSWRTDDWGTAVRLLNRTRRRLRLPRGCVVNVVSSTGAGSPAEAAILALGAGLLARAGFVPACAGVGPLTGIEVEPLLAEAVTGEEHRLAVGAATAVLPGRAVGAVVPSRPASGSSRRVAPVPVGRAPAPAGRVVGGDGAAASWVEQAVPPRGRAAVPMFTVDIGNVTREGFHTGPEPEEWADVEESGAGWVVEPVTPTEPDAVSTAKAR